MNNDPYELQRKVQSLAASGQTAQAIDLLEKTVKGNPRFVEAWMLLGGVYRALGQPEMAIEVCKKSLEHIPNDSRIWVNLGHLYTEMNQYEQAFEPLKKAVALDFLYYDKTLNFFPPFSFKLHYILITRTNQLINE